MFWVIICVSCLLMAFGALSIMGGAMSDNPTESDSTAKNGGIMFLIGLALIILDFVGRHYDVLPK